MVRIVPTPAAREQRESLMVRIERPLFAALKQWAADEDRTVSAQVRVLLREHLPNKYLSPGEESP